MSAACSGSASRPTGFGPQACLRDRALRAVSGEPGEQWTMFFPDPSGNALEFNAFADLA